MQMMANGNTDQALDDEMVDFNEIKEEIKKLMNAQLVSGHADQDSPEKSALKGDQKHTDKLQSSLKKMETLFMNEKKKMDTVEKELIDLNQHIKKLKDDNLRLEKENKELKQKFQHLSTTSKLGHTVYIHSYYHGGMMDIVRKHLEDEISLRFEDVEFKILENTDDMIQGSPLIVLCMNATRLKTDAVNALKDLKELDNTVLVIFHHKEQHALTFLPSSQSLIGERFSVLGNIFDMAFLEKKGIYYCDMNACALNGIVHYLTAYLKPKKKKKS